VAVFASVACVVWVFFAILVFHFLSGGRRRTGTLRYRSSKYPMRCRRTITVQTRAHASANVDVAAVALPDATVPPGQDASSGGDADNTEDASSGGDADTTEMPDGSSGGAALGAGCVPEPELDKSFLGFGLNEVSVESNTFSCASRICLTHHFQGRVTCPYGQTADGGGYPPATGCTIPGTDTPVDGKDSKGTFIDPTKQATVEPQCVGRTPGEAVVCSCRCANASGGVDDAGRCSAIRRWQTAARRSACRTPGRSELRQAAPSHQDVRARLVGPIGRDLW
jgi:hypothetical protein